MNLRLSGSNFLFPIIDYKVGVVLPTPVMYIVFWTIWRGKVLVKLIYGAKIAKTSPKPSPVLDQKYLRSSEMEVEMFLLNERHE